MSKKQVMFNLVGTGKNEGRMVRASLVKRLAYSATFQIENDVSGRKLYARDTHGVQEIFYSTGKTSAAAKGQTSWKIHPDDIEQFNALANKSATERREAWQKAKGR